MNTRSRRLPLKVDLEQMQAEWVIHAVLQAQAATWFRRAADWAAAAPRDGDYLGMKPDRVKLVEARGRCHRNAELCRLHGQLLLEQHQAPSESWIDHMLATIEQPEWATA